MITFKELNPSKQERKLLALHMSNLNQQQCEETKQGNSGVYLGKTLLSFIICITPLSLSLSLKVY